MASQKQSFRYSQLKQPHGFRLLRILSGDDASSVRCNLEHFLLGDERCPDYTALSYCWGDAKNTEEINVNGAHFAVTANLAAALKQLRSDRRSDEAYLWADAVCMNQADVREKTKQIGLMPRIYTGATKVVTWLSQEDRDAEHLSNLSTVQLKSPTRRRDQAAFLHAVSALSRKDYWTRIWIVQELSLARHIEVVCKGQRIPWFKFVQVSSSHMGMPLSPGSDGIASAIMSDSRIVELDVMRQEVQNAVPMPTLRALYRTRACQSTFKADRIFGILGLTSDGHSKSGRLRYQDEHRLTLLNLTLSEMEETGCLDLITFPDRRDAASFNFFTWSPNWINRALWRRLRVWQLQQVLESTDRHFRATNPSNRHKFDKNKELRVSGYSLGTICAPNSPARLKYRSPSSIEMAAESLISEFPDSTNNAPFEWLLRSHSSPSAPSTPPIGLSRQDSSLSTVSLSSAATTSTTTTTTFAASSTASLTDDSIGNLPVSPLRNGTYTSVRATGSGLYRSRLQSFIEILAPLGLRRRTSATDWLIFQDSAGEEDNAVGDAPGTRTWVRRDPAKFRTYDARYADELRTLLHLGSTYATHGRGGRGGGGGGGGGGGSDLTLADMAFATTSSGLAGLAHSGARTGDHVYLIDGCSVPVVLREVRCAPGCFEVAGEMLVLGVMRGEFFEKKKGSTLLASSFKRSEKEMLSLR